MGLYDGQRLQGRSGTHHKTRFTCTFTIFDFGEASSDTEPLVFSAVKAASRFIYQGVRESQGPAVGPKEA